MAINEEQGSLRALIEEALEDIYNPVALRRNSLVQVLHIEESTRPAETLRQLLTDAIESLKPSNDIPTHTNAWRFYHLLKQRYLEQFNQRDIANNLAISPRQLRRIKPEALQELTDYLVSRYQHLNLSGSERSPASTVAKDAEANVLSRETELERISHAYPSKAVLVDSLLNDTVRLVQPLMQSRGIQLQCELPEAIPPLAVQADTIRHALLNVLSALLHLLERSVIQISITTNGADVEINMCPASVGDKVESADLMLSENIQVARELLSISGGRLNVKEACCIELTLPTAEQATVVVMDDNEDALQLFERYLSSTRYRFVGVQQPDRLLPTVHEIDPDIIILDLMLPDTDGWRLLGELRHQPKTRRIPVLVCTILPQKDLALALGAAGFIEKPVNRQAFISALDQQFGLVPQS